MTELTGRTAFVDTILTSLHCAPTLAGIAGTTVSPDPERAKNNVTAGYQLGQHLVISCDPAAEAMLRRATATIEPSLAGWMSCAEQLQASLLGGARMALRDPQSPRATLTSAPLPDGYSARSLAPANPADRDLIADLIQASADDDLEEAELALDDLDPIIEAILDQTGSIASYASARPFELAPEYGDIAVITAPQFRHRGLGAASVTHLCDRLSREGLEPLYRCDDHNEGSIALSLRLGFTPATQLVAYRFDTA